MANYLTAEEIEFLKKRSDELFMGKTFSCGMTMLYCMSELFKLPLDQQVLDALNGIMEHRDYRMQCGLYKGALMFLGIYGAAKGWDRPKLNEVTKDFAAKFEEAYGSQKCYDIRDGKFQPTEPHDKCAPTTEKGVLLAADFIKGLEA